MHNSDTIQKQDLLSKSFVFGILDHEIQLELAEKARLVRYSAGDTIFDQGSTGQSMMAIAKGSVRVSALAPTARNVVLADLQPGDVFGEIALLDGGERSADVRASTNCELVVLERRHLLPYLKEQPDLAVKMITLLCGRLRKSDERMMECAFLRLPERIARTLLRISSGLDGDPANAKNRLSLSQSEIADMIGGTRENVNRCLRRWHKAGIIDLRDGWLFILDRNELAKLAGDT